jgi:predicted RNA-binding Zn-ribbon protein involved in translation (DUF1610 family)
MERATKGPIMSTTPETPYNAFSCPHCEASLNPGNGPIITMKGKLEGPNFAVTTNVFLPAGLGIYGRATATGVELREGARVEFSCPDCGAALSRSVDDDLAQVSMRDQEDHVFLVSFNKAYGTQSTFVIDPEAQQVESQFGDDAESFREDLDKRLNFFGS